jgi:hypothetical protein
MTDKTQEAGTKEQKGRIWVFHPSSFHEYYDERFVEKRFNNIDEAISYYASHPNYVHEFNSPVDLCIATLPHKLSALESTLTLRDAKYIFLRKDGWAPAWDEPTYHITPIKTKQEFVRRVSRYAEKIGQDDGEYVAGVSFDLKDAVKRTVAKNRSQRASNLLKGLI